MAKILVVGLNPAWQKILEFNSLRLGKVNRVEAITELASGKGFNTAKVLRRLGHEVTLLQYSGGITGENITSAAQALGIQVINIETSATIRTCTTLISGKDVTELIEPFSISDFNLDKMKSLLKGENYRSLVLCGSVPKGCPPEVYNELIANVEHSLCVMDSITNLSPTALCNIDHLKINLQEWNQVKTMVKSRIDSNKGPCISVTCGPDRAFQIEGGTVSVFSIPKIDKVRNPIGAGDTATALLVHGVLRGDDLKSAFSQALAAATASCENLLPAEYDQKAAMELSNRIQAEIDVTFDF